MERVHRMSAQDALEKLHDTKRVEEAYREQALKAQRAYIEAVKVDPYSMDAARAWTLRKEAVAQWSKTLADAKAAKQRWANLYSRSWAQGKGLAL